MSEKYNQIISSEDPPRLKKKWHIRCMAGIIQVLGRHQLHFYDHKRISTARSSSSCGSPKSSSCVEHSDNLACSTQDPARFSVDSKKIARRSLDFKYVVRDSLQRIDHPLKASIITCSATVSKKPESVRFFTNPRDQSPRISLDVKDAGIAITGLHFFLHPGAKRLCITCLSTRDICHTWYSPRHHRCQAVMY